MRLTFKGKHRDRYQNKYQCKCVHKQQGKEETGLGKSGNEAGRKFLAPGDEPTGIHYAILRSHMLVLKIIFILFLCNLR